MNNSLSLVDKLFIYFSGYRVAMVIDSVIEEREKLIKIGKTILIAACFAAFSWASAGYYLFIDSVDVSLISIMFAVVGFSIVVNTDTGFVYFVDTQRIHWSLTSLFLIVRVSMMLILNSLTSQATMPLFLKNELLVHSNTMTEVLEQQTQQLLENQYQPKDKQTVIDNVQQNVMGLREKINQLPSDIIIQQTAVQHCWLNYQNQVQRLHSIGYSFRGAKLLNQALYGQCSKQGNDFNIAKRQYLTIANNNLHEAEQRLANAQQDLLTAKATIQTKTQRANEANKGLNSNSSIVLKDLLEKNQGAYYKWLTLSAFEMLLELLPLLTKLMMGRSNIGLEIAMNHERDKLKLHARLAQIKHDIAAEMALYQLSQQALDWALKHDSQVMAAFQQAFSAYMGVLAPFHALKAMMNELEQGQTDMAYFLKKYPNYAQLISEAWFSAVQVACETMRDLYKQPATVL
jgi:hypothetical protein